MGWCPRRGHTRGRSHRADFEAARRARRPPRRRAPLAPPAATSQCSRAPPRRGSHVAGRAGGGCHGEPSGRASAWGLPRLPLLRRRPREGAPPPPAGRPTAQVARFCSLLDVAAVLGGCKRKTVRLRPLAWASSAGYRAVAKSRAPWRASLSRRALVGADRRCAPAQHKHSSCSLAQRPAHASRRPLPAWQPRRALHSAASAGRGRCS